MKKEKPELPEPEREKLPFHFYLMERALILLCVATIVAFFFMIIF